MNVVLSFMNILWYRLCIVIVVAGASALSALTLSGGVGVGQIWLRSVHCTGNESRLVDCVSATGVGNYRCDHGEDAGVRCQDINGNISCLSW